MFGAAAALRLLHFFGGFSLGMDEARLALNIAGRGWTGLTHPLDYDQSAPLVFLWIERAAVVAAGVHDWALRLPPLVAGLLVVLVSAALFRRVLGARAAAVGTLLLAVSPGMVAYSIEVKQYGAETLVAVLLVLLAIRYLESGEARALRRLAIAGVVGVWCSASAVFILAGIVLALVVEPAAARIKAAVVTGFLWATSFWLAYSTTYRQAAANPYMTRYWRSATEALWTGGWSRVSFGLEDFIWGQMVGHGGIPLHGGPLTLVVACAVAGTILVFVGVLVLHRRRGSGPTLVIVAPLIVTVGTVAAGLYPGSHRLLLFTTPLVVALGLAGVEACLARLSAQWERRAWWVVSGVAAGTLASITLLQATVFLGGSRMGALVHAFRAHRRPGEPVYVLGRVVAQWAFYTTRWTAPDRTRLACFARAGRSTGPGFENAPSRKHPVRADEGSGLACRSSEGLELIGLPSGMEYRFGPGVLQAQPDSGWTRREAIRIGGAAGPGAWVVLAEFLGSEYELVPELRRRGGRETYVWSVPGHVLARYEFPPFQPR